MARAFFERSIFRHRVSRISTLLAATAICSLDMAMAGRAAAEEGTEAVQLPTVTVESGKETAWGPVEGYVATRSAAGTKTDTPILETPRSVDVITRDQMDDRGVENMVDAVRYTAGVTTGAYGYDPRFDQIYIRGFPVNNAGDFRDGLWQGAGSFSYFRTETYGLERVDIIKGPVAALYGQTTPGGLIDRISKMPLDKAFAEVDAQIGNYDRYQAAFDVGAPLTENGSALFRLVGLARDAESQVEGTPNNSLYIAPSLTLRNDTTTLTLLGNVQQVQLPASAVYAQTTTGVNTSIPGTPSNFNLLAQTQAQVGYMLEHEVSDTWKVRQNLRYGYIDTDAYYVYLYRTPYSTAVSYDEVLNTFTVDNQSEWKFDIGGFRHKVLAGLDYRYLDFQYGMGFAAAPSYNPLIPNPVVPTPIIPASSYYTTDLSQVGLYAQDQIKFGDGWNLSLGVRNDWASVGQVQDLSGLQVAQRDDSAFTWQSGLLYAFDNGFSPYVSYATSFLPSTNIGPDNQLLEPSYGEQYEAGVKFQPKGQRSFFTVSLYQLTQTNYATLAPSGVFYLPLGDIRVRGIELEALGEILPGLDIIGSYTHSDPVVTSATSYSVVGNAPVVTPDNVASLWLKYTVQDGPLKGLGLGAGVRYIGQTYGNAANTYVNPAQTYVDAAISYEKDNWKFALNATNLAGEEYVINNEGYYYLSEGRTLIANVKYRW